MAELAVSGFTHQRAAGRTGQLLS